MNHITPIELLKERLNEYGKVLHKSFESLQLRQITDVTFREHKKNLEPKIFEYKQAIQILENWT